jgi:hypothetical protein
VDKYFDAEYFMAVKLWNPNITKHADSINIMHMQYCMHVTFTYQTVMHIIIIQTELLKITYSYMCLRLSHIFPHSRSVACYNTPSRVSRLPLIFSTLAAASTSLLKSLFDHRSIASLPIRGYISITMLMALMWRDSIHKSSQRDRTTCGHCARCNIHRPSQ